MWLFHVLLLVLKPVSQHHTLLSLEQFYFITKAVWQPCVEGNISFSVCCDVGKVVPVQEQKFSTAQRSHSCVRAHPHIFAALDLFLPICFNSPQCLIFCTLSAALISLISLSFLSMTAPQNPHSLINLLLSRIRNLGRVFLCHRAHT